MAAITELLEGMRRGRGWESAKSNDRVRDLLFSVYDERYHRAEHHKKQYQARVNLQGGGKDANYAGFITEENPKSGPYQGTSFVWFPGDAGSVAVLVVGTDGPGADLHILGRPGHRRRLRALSRLHSGRIWVKPDVLDMNTRIPPLARKGWPEIDAALKAYDRVTYAAVAVRDEADEEAVTDLLDLFFHEHGTPLTGATNTRWERRLRAIAGAVFPQVEPDDIHQILKERRFVVLEGPPGTGKTRLAFQVADRIGSSTRLQFHAARTYEDFVVGLFPRVAEQGIAFEVKAGDLLVANEAARSGEHLLLLDEINRADLARVLGEAIVLFEAGETGRSVRLPQVAPGHEEMLSLSPNLMVLGTRNTADRTIARLDLAIRRRFAFVPMWPDLRPIEQEGVELAVDLFSEVTHTFTEYADDETLRLVPGHSYYLDPRPDLGETGKTSRIARRLEFELVPLLRTYLEERLLGEAGEAVLGLVDLIEAKLLEAR